MDMLYKSKSSVKICLPCFYFSFFMHDYIADLIKPIMYSFKYFFVIIGTLEPP